MITLEFKGDNIEKFVDEIYLNTEKGESVIASMYGYKAVVYANSTREAIRQGISKKLKDIKNLEINLDLLRKYSKLNEDAISRIAKKLTPEEISDLCLECGLISNQTKKTI